MRGWALLSLAALGAAGFLALALALSRTPVVGQWLPWGPDFFYRALVTHVVLSFQVWFLGMAAVMALLARKDAGGPAMAAFLTGALWVAWAAFAVLLIPALADRGQPLLNNYVPILVHPIFIAALIALALAAAVTVLPGLKGLASGDAGQFGMGVVALALWSALVCFAVAVWRLPSGLNLEFLVERTVWGGGHVAQVVNTLLLLVSWHWLGGKVFGRGPLPDPLAKAALGGLGLFAVLAPLAYGLAPAAGLDHRLIFTRFLWLALPLGFGLFAAGLGWRLLRQRLRLRDPLQAALALSLLVSLLGGVAGFFLGVGDTRTPSHYHAVISGVNLGLMGLFPALILPVVRRLPSVAQARALPWTLMLYGGGQALHAVGFFAAGLAGVPRKTEGIQQGLNTAAKVLSMGLVGIGGTIAVLGGVGFIWVALRCLLKSQAEDAAAVPSPSPARPALHGAEKPAAALIAVASLALASVWLLGGMGASSGMDDGDAQLIDLTLRQWAIDAPDPSPHLIAGRRYRLRFHAADVVHSAAVLGREVLVMPGQDAELVVTPPAPGEMRVQCGEFCGNGHSRMTLVFEVDAP